MDKSEVAGIRDVSDTSFWVAHYRALETKRPDALFQDPFAERLVGERGQRISNSMGKISRYTEWSVVSRTVVIDRFIERLISEGVDTIINLGAGLDTRPYRMKLPPNLNWIEVDHPWIIEHKSKTLDALEPSCCLKRESVDLADHTQRREFLQRAASAGRKIAVLTEGVIPYLNPSQVTELAEDLKSHSQIEYWIAEYFHRKTYRYLQQTVRVLKMRNAPFQFYPDDWFGFFHNLGWVPHDTQYLGEIAVEFGRKQPMPWWAEVLFPIFPKRMQIESRRMTGYVVFKRNV